MASDPEHNVSPLKQYAGLDKYSDKLKFALQRVGSFMIARETHSSASVDKYDCEDGLTEDSMVAIRLGLLMWSTDKTHMEGLADKLSTMAQCPRENPVLAATDHMQYNAEALYDQAATTCG